MSRRKVRSKEVGGYANKAGKIREDAALPMGSGARWAFLALLLLCAVGAATFRSSEKSDSVAAGPPGSVTFNKDIAPIIYKECSYCHQSGQAATFDLLSYSEVAKRAKQIAKVVEAGVMPPWSPESGYGEFANDRRLSSEEKALIAQWVRDGAPEGTGSAPTPTLVKDGWILGKPDLVLQMPEEYTLEAEGADVYRNFVIPTGVMENHYVRAVQFLPDNPRIVHHAFIKLDEQRSARRLDAQDRAVGFSGMNTGAHMPGGQFLSWQPGRQPTVAPEGLAWELPAMSDLLIETHLRKTGKREKFRPSIGLYFTNTPPTKTSVRVLLNSLALDIPAGASNYTVTDLFTLPVDTTFLSVLPHMHYLGKSVEAYAKLPNGKVEPLIRIPQWDFDWQSDYTFKQPIVLPKGSAIQMTFVYDNSTNNVRNPSNPPRHVVYGPQSTDEMCELWFQALAVNPAETPTLANATREHLRQVFVAGARHRLEINPNDAKARAELGTLLYVAGDRNAAVAEWRKAAAADAKYDEPHFQMGMLFRRSQRYAEAKAELELAAKLNPTRAETFGHLGFVMASLGDGKAAKDYFMRALELNPNDTIIQDALRELLPQLGSEEIRY